MTTIAGASQYLNAATLANTQGVAAQAPSILDGTATSATGLLDVGRSINSGGLGISSSARAINQQFLNNSGSINEMFSLGVGSDATVEGAQQQILALRARYSDDQLAPSLRGDNVDQEA